MASLCRLEADGLHFVVLTTPSNKALSLVHERMPAPAGPDQLKLGLA